MLPYSSSNHKEVKSIYWLSSNIQGLNKSMKHTLKRPEPTCTETVSVKLKFIVLATEVWLPLALLAPTPQVIGTPKLGAIHLMTDFVRAPAVGCETSRSPSEGWPYLRKLKSAKSKAQMPFHIASVLWTIQTICCQVNDGCCDHDNRIL